MTAKFSRAAMLTVLMAVVTSFASTTLAQAPLAEKSPRIGKVFFAQNHVLEPSDAHFGLVSDLPALIKVQVNASSPDTPAPLVFVKLKNGESSREIGLRGPKVLPLAYSGEPELMPHSFEDSFTALIPREWIQPGLTVTVELQSHIYSRRTNAPGMTVLDRRVIDNLRIGGHNRMVLTMFDIHYFQREDTDYPAGWEEELASKLPISELEVRRAPAVVFEQIVTPPMAGHGPIRCHSMADYQRQTGKKFDGECGIAQLWVRALKRAAGKSIRHGVYYLNIGHVPANGWGENLYALGDLGRTGLLAHELGHAFSLPHWTDAKTYPYKGDMYGIKAPREGFPHAGPRWAFSLQRQDFIPPTVQEGSAGGRVGTWRKDPMSGGGFGDQHKTYRIRHFSDYSVMQMRNYLQRQLLQWDQSSGCYRQWSQKTGSYSVRHEADGWNLPYDPDAQVISILVSASAVADEANIVYPPIGPYQAGLRHLLDAVSVEGRRRAVQLGLNDSNCNVSLRVTQGGKTRTYLMEVMIDPSDDPNKGTGYKLEALAEDGGTPSARDWTIKTEAINLPAADGKVTKVQLLHTPNVITQGFPKHPRVLATWKAK